MADLETMYVRLELEHGQAVAALESIRELTSTWQWESPDDGDHVPLRARTLYQVHHLARQALEKCRMRPREGDDT